MMIRVIGFIMLALVAGAALACSGEGKEEAAPADAQRLTVLVGDSMSFEPTALAVQVGKPVLLTVKSAGATDHDFTVVGMPATDVKGEVRAGHGHGRGGVSGHPRPRGEVTIRFTPTVAGTFEFYCSVAGHREAGMKGLLTVV